MIKAASQISIESVTPEQIGACHKCFSGSTAFYLVESATSDTEYKVSWSKEKGFQCQCKAAEFGNICWHIKASIACAKEEREAVAELHMQIAVQAAMSDERTKQEAEQAKEAPEKVALKKRATAPYQPKAFSILR